MIKFRANRRIHIPNGLAIVAVVLLLVSSVVGFEANREAGFSGQEAIISAKAGANGNDSASNVAGEKPRKLNLGLLLFRRG